MQKNKYHPPLCCTGHLCSTSSHGATAPYRPLSDPGDNKKSHCWREGVCSYPKPERFHTCCLNPSTPRSQGLPVSRGISGVVMLDPPMQGSRVPWWKSHCCSARSFSQDNPCLALCSQDPSGGLGSAGRVWTHSWVIRPCSSVHTLALIRRCQPVSPGFVTPSVSVTTSLLSHLQRGRRAPPHPYLLAITFLVSCFLTLRILFIFYLFCPQCHSYDTEFHFFNSCLPSFPLYSH